MAHFFVTVDINDNYGIGTKRITEDLICHFCKSRMVLLGKQKVKSPRNDGYSDKAVYTCSLCGWWVVVWVWGYTYGSYEGSVNIYRSAGLLKQLDLTNIETPTEELKQYLMAKYNDRYIIHPKKYEDIVAGIFSDFGYRVRITSYSGDKGIDVVIFDGDCNDTVGIQVKRYANKIEADQIRELAGSLVLNNLTRGMFVTTSDYTAGAISTADNFYPFGLSIELVNADKFFDIMKISRRSEYIDSEDPSNPFHAAWRDHEKIPNVIFKSW